MRPILNNGKWVYLCRAVDCCGNIIEFLLRKYRYAISAKAFLRKAFKKMVFQCAEQSDKRGGNSCALNDFNEIQPKE